MVNTFDRGRNVAHRDFWPFYDGMCAPGWWLSPSRLGQRHHGPLCHFENFLQVHTLSHAPES